MMDPLRRSPPTPEMGRLIGVDEVGTGAWAGPAVVCAVCMHPDQSPSGLKDSKAYSGSKRRSSRASVSAALRATRGLYFCVQAVMPAEIDAHGLGTSVYQAMARAVAALRREVGDVPCVVDGTRVPFGMTNASAVVRADSQYPSVMAASVIAKDYRDWLMLRYADAPDLAPWKFERHVGYGTSEHEAAIAQFGLSRLHRKSIRRFDLTTSSDRLG